MVAKGPSCLKFTPRWMFFAYNSVCWNVNVLFMFTCEAEVT